MRESLFEPMSLGSYQLKNRIVMAPMTRGRAGEQRVPNDIMAEHYYQRASAGLLITEATVISRQGIGWIGSPGIYNDQMVEGWRKVTDRLKPTGTPLFLQLWHCGRASHSDFHDGALPVSASAVRLEGDMIRTPYGKKPYETPRPLDEAEIAGVVNDYRQAAAFAEAAGFSGVEVHGANGYLINQFLDGRSNLRQDRYGGTLENRFRFFREVLEAVLEIWPADKVGARISPNGVFNDMGCDDFRELFLYVAEEIDKLHLGYLHVMDGLAFGFHGRGEPMSLAEFRPVFKGTIIGNCGYTKEAAEQRIAEGSADLIAFGRPYITNPDLVERFANGWPLNPSEDMSLWYTPGPEGYTDYAPYEP
ncbi:MAG: alkene reductase [Desulfobulbaceae bacterium]|nr:MAG: alkene reductase [Desulfobulbaceae bacterium]